MIIPGNPSKWRNKAGLILLVLSAACESKSSESAFPTDSTSNSNVTTTNLADGPTATGTTTTNEASSTQTTPCSSLRQVDCLNSPSCRPIGAAKLQLDRQCTSQFFFIGCRDLERYSGLTQFARSPIDATVWEFPLGDAPAGWTLLEATNEILTTSKTACPNERYPGHCAGAVGFEPDACPNTWSCRAAVGDRIDVSAKCVDRGVAAGACYRRWLVPPESPRAPDWGEAQRPVMVPLQNPAGELWVFRSQPHPDWPAAKNVPEDIMVLHASAPDCP